MSNPVKMLTKQELAMCERLQAACTELGLTHGYIGNCNDQYDDRCWMIWIPELNHQVLWRCESAKYQESIPDALRIVRAYGIGKKVGKGDLVHVS